MPPRARKVDANQPDIVDALRAVGAIVQPLHMVGEGVPDLLVRYRGKLHLVEVKDGRRPPSERRLTPAQLAWHLEWAGADLHVVKSVSEALQAIGAHCVADPY